MLVINSRIKLLIGIFFIFGLLCISHVSMAANEILIQEDDVSVDTIPENPEPYQDVTVKLSSYATDLNKAMIQWQSGSSIVLSGYGKTSYSFKTQGPNTITSINVTINIPGSIDKITKNISINPTEVELMWEGVDSYTPPFYRGKSFPTAEGLIKVVAIANTNTTKRGKGDITYTWKAGDNTNLDVSGYNKDSYVFKNSELNDVEKVSVLAESINGQYSAKNTVDIPISKPKVVFYQKSPTEGILYRNALNNETSFIGDEMTIVAVPYFLSIKGNEKYFNYGWQINGEDIPTPTNKTELTVRPTERGGYANIGLTVENLNTKKKK